MNEDAVETSIVESAPGAIVPSTYEVLPRRKTPWLLSVVVFISIAGVLGVGTVHIASQENAIAGYQQRISTLNETVSDLLDTNDALVKNSQVLYDQILGLGEVPHGSDPQSVPGAQGPQGLRGIPGIPGEDGQPGVPGDRGADGKDGKDGQDGAPGQPGTQGPQGEPGQQGVPGVDGRGIASISCTNLNELTITYTDTTAQSFNIPCVP